MNPQTEQTIPDWLSAIAAPLEETSCGDDPRYLDAFQQVKEELDKLRDVDYGMIMATCRDLLDRVTKDLRIGGYHIVAAVYVDGLPGLLDGLRVYRTLLDHFWENCHPQNNSGRLAALNLLNNPRILTFAEQKGEGAPREIYKALRQELDHINSFLIEKLGEEVPRLSVLAHWVDERLRQLEPTPETTEHTGGTDPVHPSAMKAAAPVEVISEQGIEALTRQIHRHLLGSGEPLRAMAYSRAFRWGKLTLPPDEKGQTRIPAPRPGGLVEFRKTLLEGSLEDLLTCSENLFFEPGFQLLFDLQFQTHQYLESTRRPDLAGFILNALLSLMKRFPQLLDLQFDDGTPFAGPECRKWLRDCRAAGMGENARETRQEEPDGDLSAEIMDKAMQMAKRKKLTEALHSIRCLPSETAKQRVRKRLAEARLCLAAGKARIAEVVLTDVQNYILAHHLATWDPGLAVEILQQRLAALQALGKGSSAENKELIGLQTQEVRQLICQIDVVAAATLM